VVTAKWSFSLAAFLVGFGVASVLAMLAALAMGYLSALGADLYDAHTLAGVLAALAGILWLAILMFHFIYTGSAVKRAAQLKMVDVSDYYTTRAYKARLFPWLLAAMALLTCAPAMGAAVDAGKAPLWAHDVFGWVTLAALAYVVWRSRPMLLENKKILDNAVRRVNDEIERRRAARLAAIERED